MARQILRIAAVVTPLAFGVLSAQSTGERPKSEVASVKPSNSDDRRPLFDVKPELFRAARIFSISPPSQQFLRNRTS